MPPCRSDLRWTAVITLVAKQLFDAGHQAHAPAAPPAVGDVAGATMITHGRHNSSTSACSVVLRRPLVTAITRSEAPLFSAASTAVRFDGGVVDRRFSGGFCNPPPSLKMSCQLCAPQRWKRSSAVAWGLIQRQLYAKENARLIAAGRCF
jgi:hypothetical protein